MTARAITLQKEARAIFWPWCAVAFTGLASALFPAPWFDGQLLRLVHSYGFLLGIPLLASLSVGIEFQNATLSVLLSQPVSRLKLWWTKFCVVVVASLAAAVVYGIGHFTFQRFSVFAPGWLIITVCSGPFWTLVARSTIGGLVLNIVQIVIINAGVSVVEWRLGSVDTQSTLILSIVTALAYGAMMLWLGWRKFARLEVAGTVAADGLRIPDLSVLRPRTTGAVLNLIRKEVRLLWPLWLVTTCCLVLLLFLGPFQFVTGPPGSGFLEISVVALDIVILYALAALVLAGSLSMGEERVLRTHTWHLTLPVSPDLQWAVKLILSVLAGSASVCLVAFEARWIFGQPFTDLLNSSISPSLIDRLLLLACLSLVGFWCACGVNGTVRAALWTVPAICAFAIAWRMAIELPNALSYTAAMAFVVRKFHTLSFRYDVFLFLVNRARSLAMPLLLISGPLLYGLFQSRRAFRMEVQDNVLSTIRYLSKAPLFTFVVLFPIFLFLSFELRSWNEATSVVSDVHRNIRALELDLTGTDESHPRHLTDKEMTAVVTSDAAQAWLRGATIDVFAGSTQKVFHGAENLPYVRDLMSITVRMANGSECKATGYFNTNTGVLLPAFVRCDPM
jgi:hypothetical protein